MPVYHCSNIFYKQDDEEQGSTNMHVNVMFIFRSFIVENQILNKTTDINISFKKNPGF